MSTTKTNSPNAGGGTDAEPPDAGPSGRQRRGPLIVHDGAEGVDLGPFESCTAQEYLEGATSADTSDRTVVNLCRSYEYLSLGYYVTLLADARGTYVLPSLEQIEEIAHPYAYLRTLREAGLRTIDFAMVRGRRRALPELIVPDFKPGANGSHARPIRLGSVAKEQPRYAPADAEYVDIVCVLGKTRDPRFRQFCSAVFRALGFPLLHVRMFDVDDLWKIGQIAPARLADLAPEDRQLLTTALSKLAPPPAPTVASQSSRSSIACLWDPEDPFAASDEEALRMFERAAARQGALFAIIGPHDLNRLAEHDALFIRTVTSVDSISFRFAQTAESMGMPVIDDPRSILRCSNKVYLHELCGRHGIATPPSRIVSRKTTPEDLAPLGFPLVLKVPDGSFSAAVKRVDDQEQLLERMREMLKTAPLLVAQEYRPTEFDWRVGVLDGRILYTCRYYMARGHWQIARYYGSGTTRNGRVEAIEIADAPQAVCQLALESTSLIGDGLYGVDLKETETGPVLIEVNDNPSIERGYEDAVEGERLYDTIIASFLRRIEEASRKEPLTQ